LRETKSGGTIKRFAAKWKPVLVHPFANTDQRPRLPKASRRTAGSNGPSISSAWRSRVGISR